MFFFGRKKSFAGPLWTWSISFFLLLSLEDSLPCNHFVPFFVTFLKWGRAATTPSALLWRWWGFFFFFFFFFFCFFFFFTAATLRGKEFPRLELPFLLKKLSYSPLSSRSPIPMVEPVAEVAFIKATSLTEGPLSAFPVVSPLFLQLLEKGFFSLRLRFLKKLSYSRINNGAWSPMVELPRKVAFIEAMFLTEGPLSAFPVVSPLFLQLSIVDNVQLRPVMSLQFLALQLLLAQAPAVLLSSVVVAVVNGTGFTVGRTGVQSVEVICVCLLWTLVNEVQKNKARCVYLFMFWSGEMLIEVVNYSIDVVEC